MLHHQIGKHTGHTKRGVHQTRDVSLHIRYVRVVYEFQAALEHRVFKP
jgi:hypothetical protein